MLIFKTRFSFAALAGRAALLALAALGVAAQAAPGDKLLSIYSPSTDVSTNYGWSLDAFGGALIVGAPGALVSSVRTGAVYAHDFSGHLLARITSPAPIAGGLFGKAVDAGPIGVLVGAPGETANSVAVAGRAYLFTNAADPIIFENPTGLGHQDFGIGVAIVGSRAVVTSPSRTIFNIDGAGGYSRGVVYLFDPSTGIAQQIVNPNIVHPGESSTEKFGLAIAADGSRLIIGDGGFNTYVYDADPASATYAQQLVKLADPEPATYTVLGLSVGASVGRLLVTAGGAFGSGVNQVVNVYSASGTFIRRLTNPLDQSYPLGQSLSSIGGNFLVGSSQGSGSAGGQFSIHDGDAASPTFGGSLLAELSPSPRAFSGFGYAVTPLRDGTGRFAVAAPFQTPGRVDIIQGLGPSGTSTDVTFDVDPALTDLTFTVEGVGGVSASLTLEAFGAFDTTIGEEEGLISSFELHQAALQAVDQQATFPFYFSTHSIVFGLAPTGAGASGAGGAGVKAAIKTAPVDKTGAESGAFSLPGQDFVIGGAVDWGVTSAEHSSNFADLPVSGGSTFTFDGQITKTGGSAVAGGKSTGGTYQISLPINIVREHAEDVYGLGFKPKVTVTGMITLTERKVDPTAGIRDYLLGRVADSSGLDANQDGAVDVADLVARGF